MRQFTASYTGERGGYTGSTAQINDLIKSAWSSTEAMASLIVQVWPEDAYATREARRWIKQSELYTGPDPRFDKAK